MELLGSIATGVFVLDCGHGRGRILAVREGEVVLFNEHQLDAELVRDAVPCPDRCPAVLDLVELLLEYGVVDDESPAREPTRTLERRKLGRYSNAEALTDFLDAA